MNETEESVYTLGHPAVVASLEAMSYGRKSWEAARDECYAWLRVRESLDPNAGSNVGRRNISWSKRTRSTRNGPVYRINIHGPWGSKHARIRAPETLREARISPLLAKAVAKRDEMRDALVAEFGETQTQSVGFHAELRKVLQVTPEGRAVLARSSGTRAVFIEYVGVLAATAAAYQLDEWSPSNSRTVHMRFRAQPDRLELLRKSWKADDAQTETRRRNAEKRPDPRTGKKLDAAKNANRARLYATKVHQQLEGGEKLDEDGSDSAKEMFMAACRAAWQQGKYDEWHWEFVDEIGKSHKLEMVA